MGLILFIISLILLGLLCATSWIFTPCYYLLRFKWIDGLFNLNSHFKKLAISIDRFGNISCGAQLRLMFLKRKCENEYRFGNENETVSYVLAINQVRGNLSWIGKLMVDLLDEFDDGHMEKAIYIQKQRDELAKNRLDNNLYF